VVLIMVLVAGEGLRRDRSADGPRDPPAQDMKDRTGGADRTRQAAGAGRDGTSARDERDGDWAHRQVRRASSRRIAAYFSPWRRGSAGCPLGYRGQTM